jgi:putative ABC transport system permease protein
MNFRPPSWADRFLSWYCNPELLEEIQGDAHELYFERIKNEGKRWADLKYTWDVLRFFRWSNIRRESEYLPGSLGGRWNLNFKMSFRNAQRNKLIFSVKTIGLSICLAFALLLTAFIVNEFTFDQFHLRNDRIYRVTSTVTFKDHITNYAVTPLPIGEALTEDVPEVENYFRFMYEDKPIFRVEDNILYEEVTLAADSNFLKILSFDFLRGNSTALEGPDKIVLTETLARNFFGDQEPLGKSIEFGENFLLEVTAVIKDLPDNSHLQFDALISWETFEREDGWGNLNAYTYLLLKSGATIEEVQKKIPSVMESYNDVITRDYDATFEPSFEKITDIHFSGNLDEDIAQKRNKSNLYILIAVVFLFLITGLINYLNLTLAELAANSKKIGILKVFGGMAEGHRKILFAEIIVTLLIVMPIVVFLSYAGWMTAADYLAIRIDPGVFFNPVMTILIGGFLVLLLLSTQMNAYVLSKTSHIFNSMKGKVASGLSIRKFLVAAQLSFSIIMIALILIIVDQFYFIQEADKGFEDQNRIVIKVRSGEFSRTDAFSEALKNMNGVESVGSSSYYPGVIETKYVFQIESADGSEQRLVPMMTCSYDYLQLLNIKIIKGRGFSKEHSQDQQMAFIINETAAKEFNWKDAIGKEIDGPVTGHGGFYRQGEVVGVVRDFNFASMHDKIEPMIIFPSDENWAGQFFYIKTNPIRSHNLIVAIEEEFHSQWPELPFEWEYLDSKYMSLYEKDYEIKNIFEIGLIISVLISSLGVFSISALLVTLRTKEMGIRKVAGASSFQLFFLHSKSFIQFLVMALIVSCPVIWYMSEKWLQNFAYHINVSLHYFVVPGIIALVITLLTSGYHGVKSALINPVDTLKHE